MCCTLLGPVIEDLACNQLSRVLDPWNSVIFGFIFKRSPNRISDFQSAVSRILKCPHASSGSGWFS